MEPFSNLHVPREAVAIDERDLERLPASSVRIFQTILEHGPQTHGSLKEALGMPPRTIRFGLRRLKDAHCIDNRMSLQDCRVTYYFVHSRLINKEYVEQQRREQSGDLRVSLHPRLGY